MAGSSRSNSSAKRPLKPADSPDEGASDGTPKKASEKNPHLNETMTQLKSALDEWASISGNVKGKKPAEKIQPTEPVTHDALLKKTRKLLASLNQQLEDLSN